MANDKPTKIATRIKSATTGEEFYIGTTGLIEHVSVKLTAPTTVDWTQYEVLVQNISKSTSEYLTLSALGECHFEIPMGDIYEVTLPTVEDYTEPQVITYMATIAARNITHEYSHQAINLETVIIIAHVYASSQDVSVLEGLLVYATTTDGYTYSGAFDSHGRTQFTVPYGKTYYVTLPEVVGLVHDHVQEHHVAGITSREIIVHYSQQPLGAFGITDEGVAYTAEKIAELENKDIIKYVGYNDPVLSVSERGDGTRGCGFMWKVQKEVAGLSWANQNIEFDHNRLPYVTSEAAAMNAPYSGRYYTDIILEILEEKQLAGNPQLTAPAAEFCKNKSITCAGIDLNGFLGNFNEMKRAFTGNYGKSAVDAIYVALGKTNQNPNPASGDWWTSNQYSDTNAVLMYHGGFDYRYKTTSYNSVLPLYDLIIREVVS